MKLESFPFGKDYIDIILVSILLALIIHQQLQLRTRSSTIIFSYVSLLAFSFFVISGMQSGFGQEKAMADFKNHLMMPLLYFTVYSVVQKPSHIKGIIVLAALVFLAADRTTYGEYGLGLHHDYVAEQRPGGIFGAEGLGANHLGAFMAQYTMVLVGICATQAWDWRTYLFAAAVAGNFYSLLFSFSRGAWVGGVMALGFLSILRARGLFLILLLFGLFWQSLVPESVLQRLEMTTSPPTDDFSQDLDGASENRLQIWAYAYRLFLQSPVIGHGLYSFAFFDGEETWLSTHNQYLSFMAETGLIGLIVFLGLFFCGFRSGWALSMRTEDKFFQGMGLGFCACVIACMINNVFGDRWSYFSLQSLYWVFWALVDKALVLGGGSFRQRPTCGHHTRTA